MIESGQVRALAVSTASRSSSMPNVPTIAEAGGPHYDVGLWFGLLAPANRPLAIRLKLAKEVADFTRKPEVSPVYRPSALRPNRPRPMSLAA